MASGGLSAPIEARAYDQGRVRLLLGTVVLTAAIYALWCRWDGEGIGKYPLFLIIPLGFARFRDPSRQRAS